MEKMIKKRKMYHWPPWLDCHCCLTAVGVRHSPPCCGTRLAAIPFSEVMVFGRSYRGQYLWFTGDEE